MPRPYPCIESTLEVLVEDKMVRLWIDRDDLPTVLPAFRDIVPKIKQFVMTMKPPEFMTWLEHCIPGQSLNAAQLVRKDPQDPSVMVGVVVYYVEFGPDPHG